MSKIILQPTGNKDAREHYVDTIANPVDAARIKSYIPSLSSEIDAIYPNGKVYIWGVTPGKDNVNKKKWEKICKGDVTLFSKGADTPGTEGGIFASAVTTLKVHNKNLAINLWGYDKNGNTWEYIYFVAEIKNTVIPYSMFNPAVGYANNYIIQGFNVLDQEKSNKLFSTFDLYSDVYFEPSTEADFEDVVSKLEQEDLLESENKALVRKEQGFLRDYLFKGKTTEKCGICGRELPIDFLITSHIKKRSECTKTEKLDYKNIVMPMFKFGCDDAYEKGYIYVDASGVIRKNLSKSLTRDMELMFNGVDGKNCSYFNASTSKYFEAHRKKFGK